MVTVLVRQRFVQELIVQIPHLLLFLEWQLLLGRLLLFYLYANIATKVLYLTLSRIAICLIIYNFKGFEAKCQKIMYIQVLYESLGHSYSFSYILLLLLLCYHRQEPLTADYITFHYIFDLFTAFFQLFIMRKEYRYNDRMKRHRLARIRASSDVESRNGPYTIKFLSFKFI